jgi:hypothetical protein
MAIGPTIAFRSALVKTLCGAALPGSNLNTSGATPGPASAPVDQAML